MGNCIFLGRALHFSNPSQILRYPYQSVIHSPTIDSVIHYAGTIQTITIRMGMAANGWKTQAYTSKQRCFDPEEDRLIDKPQASKTGNVSIRQFDNVLDSPYKHKRDNYE